MHALEVIHDALRPGGLTLDIRPTADDSPVEVQRGGQVIPLGKLDESLHAVTVRVADAAVQTAIDAKLFTRERHEVFEFVSHFPDAQAWLAHMTDRWQKASFPDEMRAQALELLPARNQDSNALGDELRIRSLVEMTRLRRL